MNLMQQGFRVAALHGDKNQVERDQVINGFRRGTVHIVIATDVASRGLGMPCVYGCVNEFPERSERASSSRHASTCCVPSVQEHMAEARS
jgi:late competence protein required for DNA uptake (superfamily II DNA/RNA helicase)